MDYNRKMKSSDESTHSGPHSGIPLSLSQEEMPKFPLRIVFCNDMDFLSQRLGEELFSKQTHPFEKRLIVVPNVSLKDFLFHSFVHHPRLKMAAGVKIFSLNQAVREVVDQCVAPAGRPLIKKRIPSFLELSLAIEEKLHLFLSEKKSHEILVRYLNVGYEEKKQKRISSLSEQLASFRALWALWRMLFAQMAK